MKVRCRCNKRACQARRNLTQYPEEFKTWPKCHRSGCDGKMYVDKYRMRNGEKDHPPTCIDPSCMPGGWPHRVTTSGCLHKEEYILDRMDEPKSKHHPNPTRSDSEAPF